MLHKNVIEKKSGFRALSPAEFDAVAGGHYNENPIDDVIQDGFDNGMDDILAQYGIYLNDGAEGNVIVVTGDRGGGASLGFLTGPLTGSSGQSFTADDLNDPTSEINYLLEQMGLSGQDILNSLQTTPPNPLGDGGVGDVPLVDRLPDPIDLELSEREQVFSYTMQLLGVPGPLADLIAKASGILSSTDFKLFLENLGSGSGSEYTSIIFGPPEQSTGDPLQDFRNAWGPFLGPEFPEEE